MSVRAYRVNKIDIGQYRFNLWNDKSICDYLSSSGYTETLDMDGCGLIDLPVEEVKQLVNNKEINSSIRMGLKKDLQWARKNNKDFIMYYCY